MIYEWIAGNLVGNGESLTIDQAWERQATDPDVAEACHKVLLPYGGKIESHCHRIIEELRAERIVT